MVIVQWSEIDIAGWYLIWGQFRGSTVIELNVEIIHFQQFFDGIKIQSASESVSAPTKVWMECILLILSENA